MFIQTETTPNPETLKFLPGCEVMPEGTADFADAEAASVSMLAEQIFTLSGVTRVFFGNDFIAVTREGGEWKEVKAPILGAIMDHFTSERPLFREALAEAEDADYGEDAETVLQIKELLDTRVRPAVAQDGGDIVFHGYQDGVVSLRMQGACNGCPSSTATLKHGIENLLRYYVPEVTEVRPV